MTQPGALVLGANYRALGIVRSLGRRGIRVAVVDEGEMLAATSRYCRKRLRWPAVDEDARTGFLLGLAADHGLEGWVVFPTTEENAAIVARQHEVLRRRFRLTTSPWPIHRVAADKRAALDAAASIGLPIPRTHLPAGADRLDSLDLCFPVILKAAQRLGSNPLADDKAWRVDGLLELQARFVEAARHVPVDEIMIQELIPGDGEHQFSFAAVCRDGEVHGSVTARRLRQFPTDFGRASTFVESIEQTQVGELSRRLLSTIGLDGMVEIEFKHDPRTGEFKLLDVNPRAWGWHSIGAPCGVDFSYLAYVLALGADPPVTRARPGVRWVRLSTDLTTSAREVMRGNLELRPYLRSLRPPLEGPLAALDDPLPALLELPLIVRLLAQRAQPHRRVPVPARRDP
ncbi:MAG TPA: ATP-grasp domain-containing protein [Acidimicrobiales bacterium]|nr:ATP-grasp domain-containing protein [Acidimicrobiales bacterium]